MTQEQKQELLNAQESDALIVDLTDMQRRILDKYAKNLKLSATEMAVKGFNAQLKAALSSVCVFNKSKYADYQRIGQTKLAAEYLAKLEEAEFDLNEIK